MGRRNLCDWCSRKKLTRTFVHSVNNIVRDEVMVETFTITNKVCKDCRKSRSNWPIFQQKY